MLPMRGTARDLAHCSTGIPNVDGTADVILSYPTRRGGLRPGKQLSRCHAERDCDSRCAAANDQRSIRRREFLSSYPTRRGGLRSGKKLSICHAERVCGSECMTASHQRSIRAPGVSRQRVGPRHSHYGENPAKHALSAAEGNPFAALRTSSPARDETLR